MSAIKPIAEDPTATFTGWASTGTLPLQKYSYHPRPLGPKDVEVLISHCGICGSDIHTMTGGWGEIKTGHCITGHEIVGQVVKAGPKALHQVGEVVCVGTIVDACGECKDCKEGFEQLCYKSVFTYNAFYQDGSDAKSYGGYADRIRVNSEYAYKLPAEISAAEAAPLMCAGITTYSPLKHHGAGPGKKVGVLGIGGLGHLAIQWAAAMKCDEVIAISGSDSKREESKRLGATKFINAKNEAERKSGRHSVDLLILTNNDKDTNWGELIDYVANHGKIILLALPEIPTIAIPPTALLLRQVAVVGSLVGGRAITQEMLEVAAKHGIRPWIEKMPMSDANAAVKHMMEGRPRYRIVLETETAASLGR